MHGLTGSQEPRNWRTDELLRVGDDLRRQREADARDGERGTLRPRLRGWLGTHLIGVGHALAGEAGRLPPCPDAPQVGGGSTIASMRPQ